MSVVFSHESSASRLPRDRPDDDLLTRVEDFVQPKSPLRERRTGYSPGHIRSVLDLDTFGPNHSEHVEALRRSGELPASPNCNRILSPIGSSKLSPNATRNVNFTFEDEGGSTASSVESDSRAAVGRQRRPSVGSVTSLSSAGSLSVRLKTPSSRAEIVELEEELRRSTPTAKRLEYAQARQVAQKEKREAKLQEKKRKKEAQLKQQEIKDLNDDILRFELSLSRSSTTSTQTF